MITREEIHRLREIHQRVGSFYVPPETLNSLLDMAEAYLRMLASLPDVWLEEPTYPSNEQLKAIAAENPPPPEWYEQREERPW